MYHKIILLLSLLLVSLFSQPAARESLAQSGPAGERNVYLPLVMIPYGQPVLKWQYGGCDLSWCETGWYSSPATADIDGDGINEVIASAYSLVALDGDDGALRWRVGGTANRTWPGIVIADLEPDGQKEIVIAQGGGLVSAYRLDGSLKWQRQPAGNSSELRGLLVADLDGNGSGLEVVVNRAGSGAQNTWVLDAAGNTRSGWPQTASGAPGYAAGVYNTNAAAANLSGDSRLELIVPSDVHYIQAFAPDGASLSSGYPGKVWGQVGVWESLSVELRGWGECNGVRAESYRTNFADGPATIADLNGDSQREVVVTGNMYNCANGHPPGMYMALFVFNPDRTRFNTGGYDWQQAPVDTGAPLSENYNTIETVQPNPVVADLDNDGELEILYASYDGRLHAFWLDKTEHGAWPYWVTRPGEGFIRFASEPLVTDLDNNGHPEVIFTSWAQKGSRQPGKLHILNAAGEAVYELLLPAPRSTSSTWGGAMAAPTLANVDADPDLELIIQTASAGVVVYDLPRTQNARIIWGTGRGGLHRDGAR